MENIRNLTLPRPPRKTRLELVRPPEGGPARFMEVECPPRGWRDLATEALELLGTTVLAVVRRLPRVGASLGARLEKTCREIRRQCSSSY
ncbi:MAG: hypothetical protein AB7F75_06565 [Planctomycetota bacterium]